MAALSPITKTPTEVLARILSMTHADDGSTRGLATLRTVNHAFDECIAPQVFRLAHYPARGRAEAAFVAFLENTPRVPAFVRIVVIRAFKDDACCAKAMELFNTGLSILKVDWRFRSAYTRICPSPEYGAFFLHPEIHISTGTLRTEVILWLLLDECGPRTLSLAPWKFHHSSIGSSLISRRKINNPLHTLECYGDSTALEHRLLMDTDVQLALLDTCWGLTTLKMSILSEELSVVQDMLDEARATLSNIDLRLAGDGFINLAEVQGKGLKLTNFNALRTLTFSGEKYTAAFIGSTLWSLAEWHAVQKVEITLRGFNMSRLAWYSIRSGLHALQSARQHLFQVYIDHIEVESAVTWLDTIADDPGLHGPHAVDTTLDFPVFISSLSLV